jgi:hypothetical protein
MQPLKTQENGCILVSDSTYSKGQDSYREKDDSESGSGGTRGLTVEVIIFFSL